MMIENFIIMFFLFHQHELLMLLVYPQPTAWRHTCTPASDAP